MSYISAIISPNYKDVIVWERDEYGERQTKEYAAPYYFYAPHVDGEHIDLHGNKLHRYDFSNSRDMRDTRDRFKQKGIDIFESDISPEYKILSERYYGSAVPQTHITLLDIETDYDKRQGFSDPHDPYAPISAIALHHYWNNTSIVLVIPPNLSKWEPTRKKFTLDDIDLELREQCGVEFFTTEKALLARFVELIEDSDILSGWNSDGYDMPYIYERMNRVLGKNAGDKLCFDNSRPCKYKETTDPKTKVVKKTLQTFGRQSVDYLEIYKKFSVVEKPSFSLDAISEEELPHLPKLDYEGSLYDLYREDFPKFVRYNYRDCEILKGFEDKLGYMQTAILMSHSSSGLVANILGTIKLAELAIINYCHYELKCKVPDIKQGAERVKFGGGLVLPPQVGMQSYIGAIDIASLYPSTMRSLNISPETVIGQFFENNAAYEAIRDNTDLELYLKLENGEVESKLASEWREYISERKWAVSGYGTVFDQTVQGFLPAILEKWFSERKQYKKLKGKHADLYEKCDDPVEKAKHKGLRDYYDRLQYIKKIQLNSLYGALGNPYFKFYDVRLAWSTTKTGQEILLHMVKTTAKELDGEYMWPSESVIYSDTDSVYFKTHAENIQEAIVVSKYINGAANKSFAPFMRDAFLCTDGYDKLISAELDIIADRGIFCKKKIYILHILNKEGHETNEMKVMGLQIKKTTIPKPISKKLTDIVESLLTGAVWQDTGKEIISYKEELRDVEDVLRIGLPGGIRGVESYTERYTMKEPGLRVPGHVSAAIMWNACMDSYGDIESFKIKSDMKIKKYYLKQKVGGFSSIAVPTDLRILPKWFIDDFVPLIDRDAQVLRLVDKPLGTILTAIDMKIPTRKTMLFDELVEY